jgi:hypothetical protein
MMILRLATGAILIATLFVAGCRPTARGGYGPPVNSSGNPTAAGSPAASTSAPVVKSKIDVCNLLTSDDLKEVQGEAYKDANRSDRLEGEFIVAQCYYALPATVNSVVVNVTTAKDETGAPSPKGFWEQTFGGDEEKEREGKGEREREREKPQREREKEKAQEPRAREEEGEAKEASPPERVKGLGDEAFWVGSPIGGALYVLKNDLLLRVSVGGAGDQKAKLNKSKTLAQKILKKI